MGPKPIWRDLEADIPIKTGKRFKPLERMMYALEDAMRQIAAEQAARRRVDAAKKN